jgi:activator of 2-hydroxyglutaryl-CoA dehydratase
MKELLTQLRDYVTSCGATLEVLGFGATGYAADVLHETLRADVNVVETVAHMISAVKYCGEVDVVCDIGGQDIKVLFMKNGDIANFRLSNSCSAGNGMLLQAMADQFGLPVTEYADTAFGAELAPKFSYGCAVFLDTDRVNFQKEGFSKEELLAGLAQVLPKNVWQYVVQIPRLASLGTRYVLQGGTQYNLAAVKAQVDYIKERVPGAQVFVHPHTGEAGARPSSGSRPPSTSRTRRATTRAPSATSARTTASAPSSTPSAPTARPRATSRASPARRGRSRATTRWWPWWPSARRSRRSFRTSSTTSRSAPS